MTDKIIQDADGRMRKSIESLKNELVKIRTGRAHPSLLEHIVVNYYGSEVPLSQVANVNVLDAQALNVTVFDKNAVSDVEKAILNSNMGLNPVTVGPILKVPLPRPTEERRKELSKIVRVEVEKGKVAIRNIRRDAKTHLKDMIKDKEISEDDERRAEDHLQKLTDSSIAEIDKMLEAKESDLMEI